MGYTSVVPMDHERAFSLDLTGVTMIGLLAFVVAPVTIGASLWVLTDGFDLASARAFELVVSAVTVLLGLWIIRAAVRELKGGLGVRIDDQGVSQRGLSIRWDEVDELRAPNFGLLEIHAGDKQLTLRTYLFSERRKLLEYVAEQTGKTVPEMGTGY